MLDSQIGNTRGLTSATGGVEQKLQVVERHLDYRRHVLLNRARTNRLLFLIQLQENLQASETRYAKLIREFLEADREGNRD